MFGFPDLQASPLSASLALFDACDLSVQGFILRSQVLVSPGAVEVISWQSDLAYVAR